MSIDFNKIMFSLLQFLKNFLARAEPRHDADETYLAGSVDIYDLERRMRNLDQRQHNALVGCDAFGLSSR